MDSPIHIDRVRKIDRAAGGGEIPQPLTTLVGREHEIAALRSLVEEDGARLVTLTGPGGIGKTRLALAVAEQLVDHAPDGVWFVPLASIADPALVVPAIARVLEVGEGSNQPLLERLVDHLDERRAILVLDNFEHLVAASTDIAQLLISCRELRVVVTSRGPLRLTGEREYQVPPLALPDPDPLETDVSLAASDAVLLFVDRASMVSPGFALTPENAPLIAEICRRLDGLPLALELAAARVKLLSPDELLTRLDQPLSVLSSGPRDAPPRQQTMRNTLQWSYDLLSHDEQVLFRQLAVFAGSWTLASAEAVAGGDTLVDLASLVDKGLVRRRDLGGRATRYGMLLPVRQFAREKLDERGDELEAVRSRHAEYFLSFVDDLRWRLDQADGATLFAAVEMELDNLRATLSWLRETGCVEQSLRLTGHLLAYMVQRGHIGEGWALAEAALSLPGAEQRTIERARVLWMACWLLLSRDQVPLAIQLSDEAWMISSDLNDRGGMAESSFIRGICLEVLGDLERARADYERALGLFREIEEHPMTVRVLTHLGVLTGRQGEHTQARSMLEEALKAARARRLPNVTALVLGALSSTTEGAGTDLRTAELLEEALRIYGEFGKPRQLADMLDQTARLLVGRAQPESAVCLLSAAATLRERSGALPWRMGAPRDTENERAALQAMLSESVFTEAWERGQGMDLRQAVDFAQQVLETFRATSTPSRPAGLTSREVEILGLIAAGKSNRQIAAELFLSSRTVERHVANIYNKIDAHNRAEATAFALSHGLA